MSYEILGRGGRYWMCHQLGWRHFLEIATAFGWVPEGAWFKNDEGGFGPHPSGSYLGNDGQIVTDTDARAMSAALNLAVATVSAGSPMTDEQTRAVRGWMGEEANELVFNDGSLMFGDEERLALIRKTNFRRCTLALADLAAAGGFTII